VQTVHAVCCNGGAVYVMTADGITPRDIKQGSLGNCWLLSGLACIAQSFPELIESRFVAPRDPETGKPTISTSGRYRIQLWDMRKNTWADIVIDDMWVLHWVHPTAMSCQVLHAVNFT